MPPPLATGTQPPPWCTAHIKMAVVTIGLLVVVSLISRQCSVGVTREKDKAEAAIKECERLALAGDISGAAGGVWVLRSLSGNTEICANSLTLTIDQARRVSELSRKCRQKAAAARAVKKKSQQVKTEAKVNSKMKRSLPVTATLKDVFDN